jgi:hypothetical protein
MYRRAGGRIETADRQLRHHTVFAAKINKSFNDPLGLNLRVCMWECNKVLLFQRKYENEVLRIKKNVQMNFTFMGSPSIQTTVTLYTSLHNTSLRKIIV